MANIADMPDGALEIAFRRAEDDGNWPLMEKYEAELDRREGGRDDDFSSGSEDGAGHVYSDTEFDAPGF